MEQEYQKLINDMNKFYSILDECIDDLTYVQNNMHNAFNIDNQGLYHNRFEEGKNIIRNNQRNIKNIIIPEIRNKM